LRAWHASFISRHAQQAVAISHAVAECFSPEVRAALVYNAVDLAEFDLSLSPAEARTSLGLDQDRPVLMVIGSVQRAKGHWLLLDALQHLPPDVQTVLVTGGVGPEYARTWKGRVKRIASVPLDNLDALLRDARK